jgi:RimJ/RimL family protein N-acetyltransferase
VLTDGAVTLRAWTIADADALAARLDGDAAVATFLDLIPQPYTRDDALAYLAHCEESWRTGANSSFAVLVEGIDQPVGSVGVHWRETIDDGVAEIGYWIAKVARSRGAATAGVRLAARWAFAAEPALERLQLRADVENAASNRVAEKAGFVREGVLRSSRWNARLGRRADFVVWSLLRAEVV